LYPYLWRNGQRTEKWHGVTKPHLSDLGALLGALPQLRLLYLQEMRVGDFSGYAASLQGLRVLHVQRVEGLCAPGVLSAMLSLSNLRHLGLKHCLLRDQLQWPGTPHVHLTSLDFSGSRVSQGVLKGLLWHCSGLQTLHLSNTRLGPSLPLSISRLTALRSLWMDQSSVRRLPDTITALPGLRHLLWHGKVAMDEFRVVWRLTSLQSLSLGCDGLMVPAAISQLTQLSSLSLAVKWLSELPASLSTLVRLESLVVDTPYVAAIPEGITALTWLRSMSVSPAVLPRLSPAVHEFVSARSHPAP
jgi:internalin A